VNHDLIAAGHPRLNWEFSAYSATYPKHWNQKGLTTDWDARLWKVGQIATMKASADLLAARADQAVAKSAPWPELSEYGCFSCHFALQKKPFRGNTGSPLGMPQWASWNLAVFPTLARLDGGDQASKVETRIDALRASMGKLGLADPALVGEQARALSTDLDGWLATQAENRANLQIAPNELIDWVNTLKESKANPAFVRGWDSAAQLYLALTAAHASLGAQGRPDTALSAELKAMVDQLGFEKGYDSPKGLGGVRDGEKK